MIVIAYYTINTPYEREVQNLVKSLQNHNLEYDINGYKSQGSWQANIAIKPQFIYNMLLKHIGRDLLYLDADAVVEKPLEYTLPTDMGIHYLNGKELLSGTIFLKNTSEVMDLVAEWITLQKQQPTTWDQVVLQNLLAKQSKVTVDRIPESYCKIFDRKGESYITQNQASRRHKCLI